MLQYEFKLQRMYEDITVMWTMLSCAEIPVKLYSNFHQIYTFEVEDVRESCHLLGNPALY